MPEETIPKYGTYICIECFELDTDPTYADNRIAVCNNCQHQYNQCDSCGHVNNWRRFEQSEDTPNTYCEKCLVEHTTECYGCGYRFEDTEEHEENEYCEACYSDTFSQCDRCEGTFDRDHIVIVYSGEYRNYEHEYCADCVYEYATRCEDCDEYVLNDYTSSTAANVIICDQCLSNGDWCWCGSCGEVYRSDYCHHNDYGCTCPDCHGSDNQYSDYRNVEATTLSGLCREAFTTFGVEIEAEFDGECPFDLGDYHSDYAASNEFFGGWHAEEDCTVDGEFISPPLSGAGGLAEVIATYRVLQDGGARMTSSCGQHITVNVGDRYAQVRAQSLVFVLEESLLALTGSYNRLHNASYCQRLKKFGYVPDGENRLGAKMISVSAKRNGLVEYRYPPGTLNPEQLAINTGLVHLISRLARNYSELGDATLNGMVETAMCLESAEDLDETARMQQHILHGLEILRTYGWHEKGELIGLLYNPDNAPVIEVLDHDYSRGHCVTVELPNRCAIFERMRRQLKRFYNRAGLSDTIAEASALDVLETEALTTSEASLVSEETTSERINQYV